MRISKSLLFSFLFIAGIGCNRGESAPAEPAEPAIGASCEHLGATEGAFACEGNTVIFCSTMTDNTWEAAADMFQCDEGKTCTELEGNQTSCQ